MSVVTYSPTLSEINKKVATLKRLGFEKSLELKAVTLEEVITIMEWRGVNSSTVLGNNSIDEVLGCKDENELPPIPVLKSTKLLSFYSFIHEVLPNACRISIRGELDGKAMGGHCVSIYKQVHERSKPLTHYGNPYVTLIPTSNTPNHYLSESPSDFVEIIGIGKIASNLNSHLWGDGIVFVPLIEMSNTFSNNPIYPEYLSHELHINELVSIAELYGRNRGFSNHRAYLQFNRRTIENQTLKLYVFVIDVNGESTLYQIV